MKVGYCILKDPAGLRIKVCSSIWMQIGSASWLSQGISALLSA